MSLPSRVKSIPLRALRVGRTQSKRSYPMPAKRKQIARRPHAHQVARPIRGQQADGLRRHARRLRPAARRPTDRRPHSRRTPSGEQRRRARRALRRIEPALHDAEERHVGAGAARAARAPPTPSCARRRARPPPAARRPARTRRATWRRRRRAPPARRRRPPGAARRAARRRASGSARPSSSTVTRAARLITWKPPLSVRIGPSQPMKRCRPPSACTTSTPGRSDRW